MRGKAISGQRSVISQKISSTKLKAEGRTLNASSCAFSLIEVTLALAIVAIGLLAIVGILPHGIQASRDAADNTVAATIVQDVLNNLRSGSFLNAQPTLAALGFTVPPGFSPVATPFNLSSYDTSPPSSKPKPVAYFDQAGGGVDAAAAPQDCYLKIELSFNPQAPVLLSTVIATVYWPAKPGMTSFLNTNVFISQIAQYE